MKKILPGVDKGRQHLFIGDDVYFRTATDKQRLRVHDLGNGHLEVSAQRVYEYVELELDALAKKHLREDYETLRELTPEELAEREALHLERAAKRAKSRVRRFCKVMAADTLLTLTYRANVTDLAQTKAHLKEFVRRLRRVVPGFRAVAAFERQKRGAWHVHLATLRFPAELAKDGHKVKSFNLLRSIWRSVTGEAGGNVDVSADSRSGGRRRTCARIASYISKYITKAFEDGDKHSNRWTKFGEFDLPKPMDLGQWESMREAVEAAYALITESGKVVTQALSQWGDFFFLVVEDNHVQPPA